MELLFISIVCRRLVVAYNLTLLAVSINDEDMDLDKPFTHLTSKANITFDPFVEDVGEQVQLSSGLFTFVASAVKAFDDDVSGYNRYAAHATASDIHTQ